MKARFIVAALIVILCFVALLLAGDLSHQPGSFIADPDGHQR
jgi:hypothetical protein